MSEKMEEFKRRGKEWRTYSRDTKEDVLRKKYMLMNYEHWERKKQLEMIYEGGKFQYIKGRI